jgi:DNA polymerase (family 10)
MDKRQVAAILEEIGTLLELQGENTFRCLAYHKAARAIEQLQGGLDEVVAQGRLGEIRDIGSTLAEKITELVKKGELPFHTELRQKTPPGLFDLLHLQGMGPKKVRALYDHLGIESLEQLKQACQDDRVAQLKGFGNKTQQKLLEAITFRERTGQRVRIDQAQLLAHQLLDAMADVPGIRQIALCGSLRRCKETIQDIDLLLSADEPGPIMEHFVSLPGVVQVLGQGDTKSSIALEHDLGSGRRLVLNADLRVVGDEQFPFALHYFTGSKEHNIAIRARAQRLGLKLNEYELAGADGPIPCQDEAALFKVLGLDYIPPELRENTGEIEAAAEHRLPHLVELRDLRGTFHCHTNWSDGRSTLEEMVESARARGLKYFGIADHSQSLTVARGLTPERVRQQWQEIDRVAKRFSDIRLFKGTECDILPDGRLDFDDELLAGFDYVVASVHTSFNLPEPEMTARVVRAVSHPRVTMLGHSTGRLLLQREGYKIDLDAVLKAAAATGTMVEINAHPQRLDLDWMGCRRAKALGVTLVINPDAHNANDVGLLGYGVDVARRGWLEKSDIFNTRTAAQVAKALAGRKAR